MTVDLPVEERHGLLESLCAHDDELRADVESLLASDCDSGTVIAEAVQSEASMLFDLEPLPGKRVGAYRIVREIGRGGMGAVFLATRDDEVFQKRVAIKVVKPGMDTAEVLDRFRYERQILASLEHPYIARLFDGGSTDEGLPFFVMEYIEGDPVNVFCRGKTLNNRARCELFLKILNAVSYAHRNLVVHRDLKPGNIFVTPDGIPMLLDFGVAKLISGNGDGGHTATTLLRPFTPEYASPEQVLGLSVTTSTDIYSLGAVFYELLTDRRAQPILTPTPSEIERAVCEMEVPRPSLVAPSVDEDLDNIVLMAMRKEPERRYHSADQFAEDIERYLSGRAILARQDSVTYRLRKFLGRNRLEIATVTVLILGLSGGLAVSLYQTRRAGEALKIAESQRLLALHENSRATAEARRAEDALASEARQRAIAERQTTIAEEERDVAQRETAVADERVTDLFELANRTLFDVHDSVAKLPGSMDARKEIVKTTLDYLERLRQQTGLDDRMRLMLSAAYEKIAVIQGSYYTPSLQDFDGAEASLRKSIELLLPLYERNPKDTEVTKRYLDIQIELADDLEEAGKPEAIAMYTRLLPIARRLAQETPCDLDCERKESTIENQLSHAYSQLDDPRTVEHAEREESLTRDLLSRHPGNADLRRDYAISLSSAANAQKLYGNLERAAEGYRESIQIREELLKADATDNETRRGLFIAYGNYAGLLGVPTSANLGQPTEARAMAERCVTMARESVAADAKDATARFDLAMALGTLGMIDPPAGGVKDSLATLQEVVGLMEEAVKTDPQSAFYATQLALILEHQGHRLESLLRTPEAIGSYRKSLATLTPFLGTGNVRAIRQNQASEEALALALASMGDNAAALAGAAGVVAELEKAKQLPETEAHTGDLARAYAALGAVQEKAGHPQSARQSAEKASALWQEIHNAGILSTRREMQSYNAALLARLQAAPAE